MRMGLTTLAAPAGGLHMHTFHALGGGLALGYALHLHHVCGPVTQVLHLAYDQWQIEAWQQRACLDSANITVCSSRPCRTTLVV